jgi:hypothetical protein
VESQREEVSFVFPPTGEDRLTLARLVVVVEGNCWLDDAERALLEPLEGSDAPDLLPTP